MLCFFLAFGFYFGLLFQKCFAKAFWSSRSIIYLSTSFSSLFRRKGVRVIGRKSFGDVYPDLLAFGKVTEYSLLRDRKVNSVKTSLMFQSLSNYLRKVDKTKQINLILPILDCFFFLLKQGVRISCLLIISFENLLPFLFSTISYPSNNFYI